MNLKSPKIQTWKQFSAFHGNTFHFSSMPWILIYVQFKPFQQFQVKSRWNWQFFYSKSNKWGKLSFTDFMFHTNGKKWNKVFTRFTESLVTNSSLLKTFYSEVHSFQISMDMNHWWLAFKSFLKPDLIKKFRVLVTISIVLRNFRTTLYFSSYKLTSSVVGPLLMRPEQK